MHVDDQLPFYINQTLPEGERAAVKTHLAGCAACRESLATWEQVADQVQSTFPSGELPPLAAWVSRSLCPNSTLGETFQAMVGMVWAQRAVMLRGAVLPAVGMTIAAGVLAALLLNGISGEMGRLYTALPLFVLVPLIAVLSVAYLHVPENDPAFELISAAPTHPGALVSARLTLALGMIGSLALLGSLLIGEIAGASLRWLVGAWLGPMLLLAALTTLLTLLWSPQAAVGISLALWGGVVTLAFASLQNTHIWRFRPLFLLQPAWEYLLAQLLVAGLLWGIAGYLMDRGVASARRLEAGK